MASEGQYSSEHSLEHRLFQQAYISPLAAVRDFFEALTELKGAANGVGSGRLLEVCERVSLMGEKVVLCLEQQMKQQNRASEMAQEVSGVFRIGLQRLVQLRSECSDLRTFVKELQLAEHGLDARITSTVGQSQNKYQTRRDFAVTGSGNAPVPRAVSYEDFRKHMDSTLSKKSSEQGSGFAIRKAKSDTDIAMQTMKKKVEGLTVDNTRLKQSEKKLLKDNIKLNRNVKSLEKERDRAEDRLKIEQTQRDSIEKLRQKNKILEEQLRKLCETQVIRERAQEVLEEIVGGRDEGVSTEEQAAGHTDQ